MIFAFAVASGFFYVFDLAIDTVLLCFLIVRTAANSAAADGTRPTQ